MVRERENQADFSLSKTFKDYAELSLRNLEISALMGNIDAQSPGVLAGGINSRMGIPEKVRARIRELKGTSDFYDLLFQILVQEALDRINVFIAEHEQRMRKLQDQIDIANSELENLNHEHTVIEDEVKFYERYGMFNLDANGQFENQAAEKIVVKWENETGQFLDRRDPISYTSLLELMLELERQQFSLRGELGDWTAEYHWHVQQRDSAISIRDQLFSSDPVLQQQALSNIETLLEGSSAWPENSRYSEMATEGLRSRNPSLKSEAFRMNFQGLNQSTSTVLEIDHKPNAPSPL